MNHANIYLFRVNNRNTKKRYELCPKLTIKTWLFSCFFVNFEYISQLFPMLLLLNLNKVNVNWVTPRFQRSDWFVVYAF